MQLNIQKHYFYNLNGISGIKAHIEKLNNLVIDGSKSTGVIEINISYQDLDGMECFKVIPLPFELDLDEIKIIDVNLGNIKFMILEGEGLDIEYNLVINYLTQDIKKDENKIELLDEEVPLITDVEFSENQDIDIKEEVLLEEVKKTIKEEFLTEELEEIEKIKEDISKKYEDILTETLKQNNIRSHQTENRLPQFQNEKRYILKCIYVNNEEELNQIAKKYNVSLQKLLSNYDRNSRRVIFSID